MRDERRKIKMEKEQPGVCVYVCVVVVVPRPVSALTGGSASSTPAKVT